MRVIFFSIAVVLGITTGFSIIWASSANTSTNNNFNADDQLYGDELLAKYNTYFRLNVTFEKVLEAFKIIAAEQGAHVAFDVLVNSNLPPAIDTHLMGHFVGDILYDQQGIEGLAHCTDAIGFACAHSIVINALLDKGPGVFEEINDICAEVPGGNGYMMCFHGFGHGVLAYTQYHLPEAIIACEQVGTKEYGYQEAKECVGGVIMEMRGGIHNPILWEENGAQYLDIENPLHMCQAEYMPDAYRDYCYVYITPFIFDAVTTQDIPSYEDFGPAMNHCTSAPAEFQETCFGGFAKEFLGFFLGRDIRLVETMSIEQLGDLWAACQTAPTEQARAYCAKYAVYNLYRSGNHPYEISADFCGLVTESLSQNACFANLQDQVFENNESVSYRDNFCVDLNDIYEVNCQSE
jgi:hypothetical protein